MYLLLIKFVCFCRSPLTPGYHFNVFMHPVGLTLEGKNPGAVLFWSSSECLFGKYWMRCLIVSNNTDFHRCSMSYPASFQVLHPHTHILNSKRIFVWLFSSKWTKSVDQVNLWINLKPLSSTGNAKIKTHILNNHIINYTNMSSRQMANVQPPPVITINHSLFYGKICIHLYPLQHFLQSWT